MFNYPSGNASFFASAARRNSQFAPKQICHICEQEYTIGVNGTVDGCDGCLKVVRNAVDNTIIDELDEAGE